MSNKSDFYALTTGKFTYQDIRRYVTDHPGVQWRKSGKDTFQVMFRSAEGWLDWKSFRDNYRSKLVHDLMDSFHKASSVLPPEEFLNTLLKMGDLRGEVKRAMIDSGAFITKDQEDARVERDSKLLHDALGRESALREELKQQNERLDSIKFQLDQLSRSKDEALRLLRGFTHWVDNMFIIKASSIIPKLKEIESHLSG